MQIEREVTIIYKWKLLASRPTGRPKNKWEDDVRKNLKTAKIKNWKNSVLNRDLWKTVVDWTKCSVNRKNASRKINVRRNTTVFSNC
jgi:hypothetical protein